MIIALWHKHLSPSIRCEVFHNELWLYWQNDAFTISSPEHIKRQQDNGKLPNTISDRDLQRLRRLCFRRLRHTTEKPFSMSQLGAHLGTLLAIFWLGSALLYTLQDKNVTASLKPTAACGTINTYTPPEISTKKRASTTIETPKVKPTSQPRYEFGYP